MTHPTLVRIYFYSRVERCWHWVQAILIMLLLLTGFEVHGVYTLMGYETAVDLHNTFGITWLVLYVFIAFWMITTGEWKQYVPTTKKLLDVMIYYAYGIFRGEAHPVPKTPGAKHNPLQRLTYLGLATVLLPVQMLLGLLFYLYNEWPQWGIDGLLGLGFIAFFHTLMAFMLLSFLIVHVYMTTTGHTITAHVKAMITGWEEVPEGTLIEDWETADRGA